MRVTMTRMTMMIVVVLVVVSYGIIVLIMVK